MKKYEILYAQDIPHYGAVELEAESDAEIVEAAKAYWSATDLDPVDDPDWNNPVRKRIVSIRDEAGNDIASDIRCDDYNLEYITDDEVTTRENAAGLLEALRLAIRALNATPDFDTGIPDPDSKYPSRPTMSSYKLVPKLEAISRKARGQQ